MTSVSQRQAPTVADLLAVLWAPRRILAHHRTSAFGGALVLVWVALLTIHICNNNLGRHILERRYDQRVAEISARVGAGMPQDAFEAGRRRVVVADDITAVVAVPIRILGVAVVCALGLRLLGVNFPVSQSVLLCVFGSIPFVVGGLTTLVQLVILDTGTISSFNDLALSPARLFPSQLWPRWLQLLAAHCAVPELWGLAILGIGFREFLGLKWFEAVGFLVVLWAVSLLPSMMAWVLSPLM